jgi:membrane fusion protein (multidrug efflux system)
VVRTPDGSPQVWKLDAEDRVAPQRVVTGRSVGNAWLIESGLAPGDRVVAEGLQKIRPGAKVSAVPATVKVADRQVAGG